MTRQKEAIDSLIAEAILGEPIPHHRHDWHYKDKANHDRCDLLGFECPLLHFVIDAAKEDADG